VSKSAILAQANQVPLGEISKEWSLFYLSISLERRVLVLGGYPDGESVLIGSELLKQTTEKVHMVGKVESLVE